MQGASYYKERYNVLGASLGTGGTRSGWYSQSEMVIHDQESKRTAHCDSGYFLSSSIPQSPYQLYMPPRYPFKTMFSASFSQR